MFVGTGTIRKPREYAKARELRRSGKPLKRIAATLGVSRFRLDLGPECLRKHHINPLPSSSGKKKNRLPYGVCTLTVNSTRLIQHIHGAIQEYGGFDEPRWLD